MFRQPGTDEHWALQFVDDVEFYFPDGKNIVEYRSASRLGESDGDINRKRIRVRLLKSILFYS